MLYLTFITVGDLPKGSFQEIGSEFKKRLGAYVKLTQKIVSDETKIAAAIPDGDVICVLDAAGKQMTSESLAKALNDFENDGRHVTVILGGPKGLSDETKKGAHLLLSLSPMTTTHDLAHLFFLEQLYRAMTIAHGKEYHY